MEETDKFGKQLEFFLPACYVTPRYVFVSVGIWQSYTVMVRRGVVRTQPMPSNFLRRGNYCPAMTT